MRERYAERMGQIREAFRADGDGLPVVRARTQAVDELLVQMWKAEAATGVAVVAIGGYGRQELYPQSDIDVLFCVERGAPPKDAIRRISQGLWDCGLRMSTQTRMLADCERFDVANAELGFALFDRRYVAGDEGVFARLDAKLNARTHKDAKAMRGELLSMTRERYRKYGDTLFHLEPNVKECPGGLRDAHAAGWLARLQGESERGDLHGDFAEAVRFLASARCFLHFYTGREDNVLDWTAQDEAATGAIAMGGTNAMQKAGVARRMDASHWMRGYFRHARVVERTLARGFDRVGLQLRTGGPVKRERLADADGFRLREGRLEMLEMSSDGSVAAGEPAVVLALFAAMGRTGAPLTQASEEAIADGIPLLSAHLEDGPALWQWMAAVLTAPRAGEALRAMHALGVLDLILPEFHGIDALVIRDAYHRYTVDEHTFVVIDTLHALESAPAKDAPEWRVKLGQMARELAHPAALYLAALLHDTGKGRAGDRHAEESAHLAAAVLARWEVDTYEAALVLGLIQKHLEMSAALRRDIFDRDTVRQFTGMVQTQEALRMLTLFTYADIEAVHPDALTPWKAENLWRLSMNASNQLDRSVDEERVHVREEDDRVTRIVALSGGDAAVRSFLEGFPERYLLTRPPEQIAKHFALAKQLLAAPVQIQIAMGGSTSEVVVITRDRPNLFAGIAGTLAAWGMNVVTADAFANADGVVVDSFRFTDTFQTLALNETEVARFETNLRDVVLGTASVEKMLAARKRGRRRSPKVLVTTRVEFDANASQTSTLMQLVSQDVPGLLRAVSATLNRLGYNVEVALIDTEGETAIDVFYLTRQGSTLRDDEKAELRVALLEAVDENAR